MQTGPNCRHSPIGSFQRTCYVVGARAANGPHAAEHGAPSLAARQHATSQDVSSCTAAGDGAAHGQQRPGHLRMLMLTRLGVLASLPASQPRPRDVWLLTRPCPRWELSVPAADRQVDRQPPRQQGFTADDAGRLYTS
jgi:hypothetical protein